MRRIAEKPDFTNARAVRVCAKVMSVSVQMHEEPYIYGILRKSGHGMDYSLPCNSEFCKISMLLGENYVL